MLVDTHAHIDFPDFDRDRSEVIKRASKAGVERIINVGCNLKRSRSSVALAEKNDNIFAAVGVHPHDVLKMTLAEAMSELNVMVSRKKVVAVGEIGLDFFRAEGGERTRLAQIKFFREQLGLARREDQPVILHVREAYEEVLEIIKKDGLPERGGVVHCFSAGPAAAEAFLAAGLHISFTGLVTFPKAEEVVRAVRVAPLERVMVETDCPFLAPEPKRGKRNEPGYVKYVAQKVAEIKGLPIEEVEFLTTRTANQLFGLGLNLAK